MNDKRIDLHIHSTASDGTLTPEEIVQASKEAGLAAIALTDHDTVTGVERARDEAQKSGIEFVPGVELSTDYMGKELHVVGLFIDIENKALCDNLKAFVDERDQRNEKMAARLREEGFDITIEKLCEINPNAVLTRAHFAGYLVNSGQVKDKKTVFSEYLGDGCKCFVDRELTKTPDAVRLIKQAGGIAILAHPVLYKYDDETLKNNLRVFIEAGLDGMEVVYSTNTPEDEKKHKKIAAELGLIYSGGSDFHGANKPDIHLGTGFGNMYVPYEFLEKIKAYAGR